MTDPFEELWEERKSSTDERELGYSLDDYETGEFEIETDD